MKTALALALVVVALAAVTGTGYAMKADATNPTSPKTEPPPTLVLSKTSWARNDTHVGYIRVGATLGLCLAVGPRAQIKTIETLRIRGHVVARKASVDPLGVDLTKIYPSDCTDWQTSWAITDRAFYTYVTIGGTYSVTFRLIDGYGRSSPSVGFSVIEGHM